VQGLNAKVDEQTTLLQSRLESAVHEKDRQLAEQAATIREQQREIAELSERMQKAETLADDVVALKAVLAELQRGRETVAAK
jgi:DNA-binding protein H-NS